MDALLTIENGARAKPTFSDQEMARRLESLRAHMAERAIEAVLFTSMQNIAYFSDFLYVGFGRPYGLVVTADQLTTITANIDAGRPWRRARGDHLVYTDWQQDNFYRAVQRLIPPGARVGIERDHLTLTNLDKLEAALPSAMFFDIAPATMRQRMIKSAEEIALIEAGAAVADVGGAACVAALEAGVPEYEVAEAGTAAMVREIASRFPDAELRDTWVWFQSGINTDGAHNPLTSRRIAPGDILSLNCFPMIAGYYMALERTLFLDHASDAHLRYWEINTAVHRQGLELIRPGVRCSEIAAELNRTFAGHGLLERRTFGYGHSFGLLCHYYGREAGLELREDVDTVLEPDMVVSMEPMIMIPEGEPGAGGYREHDILVVTEDGARNITHFPLGPEHNIISR